MVLWVAIAGLLVWVSFEFLLRGPGEARRWVGAADTGHSTHVLLASFLVSLGISFVLSRFRVALAPPHGPLGRLQPARVWARPASLVYGDSGK